MKPKFVSLTTIIPILVLLSGCGQAPTETVVAEVDYTAEANRLAQEILLVDTHIDLPYRLHDKMEDVSVRTEGGHFDYVRARDGGLDAAFMSIYIPASYQEKGGARELGDQLIDIVEGLQEQAPDKFVVARSVADVRTAFEQDIFALPLGIENGAAIEDDLANLQHFYDRGVRYVTLTHGEANLISDSSYDEERIWNGLSPFGREVVAEMNRLGMMVDISHVTDETFYQVMEISKAPAIASHSCARYFTPGFERNMSDEMITKLAENGGVIQIAFAPGFLSAAAHEQSMKMWATMRQFIQENKVSRDSPEVRERLARFYEENPKVEVGVADVADHIEHVINLVGVDHVGIGSDFDGIGEGPAGLEDVSGYPNLIEELLRRGYREDDIRKICAENLLRVWSEVERAAQESQAS
jgi:membrane dipeptidase